MRASFQREFSPSFLPFTLCELFFWGLDRIVSGHTVSSSSAFIFGCTDIYFCKTAPVIAAAELVSDMIKEEVRAARVR